jgi:hypothetical protein
MTPIKYSKYVINKPVATGGYGPEFIYTGEKEYNSSFTIMFLRITEPTLMEEFPHSHDFDMYLYFMSFDPDNMGDLGADIEIGLGKEQEIHKITTPTTVYIPAGMVHCPLEFKRVDKPVLFVHCTLASKYVKDAAKIIKDK